MSCSLPIKTATSRIHWSYAPILKTYGISYFESLQDHVLSGGMKLWDMRQLDLDGHEEGRRYLQCEELCLNQDENGCKGRGFLLNLFGLCWLPFMMHRKIYLGNRILSNEQWGLAYHIKKYASFIIYWVSE